MEEETIVDAVLDPLRFRMLAVLLAKPTTIEALSDALGSKTNGQLIRLHAARHRLRRPEGRAISDEDRTLQNFIDGARLKSLPVVLSKKRIVLRWLAKRFDPDRRYEEREVNRLLEQAHPDFATLRRELVDNGLMERERGMYWRSSR